MTFRHALLALLSEGPKYGLQLSQEFEARTGEVWPLNTGQVYTTLQRLERDGLVESDDAADDGPQKGFRHHRRRATTSCVTWLRTPPDTSAPPRDELVIKVLVALRVPGVDLVELVQAHRRHLVETMRYYTRLKEDAGEHDVGLLLVADAEIYPPRWRDPVARRRRRADQAPARDTGRTVACGLAQAASPGRSAAMMASARTASGFEVVRRGACPRRRAARRRPRGPCRRAGRDHGSERVGQEHAVDDRRDPRGRHQRARSSSTATTCRPCRATIEPGCGAGRSATCSRTSTCWPG